MSDVNRDYRFITSEVANAPRHCIEALQNVESVHRDIRIPALAALAIGVTSAPRIERPVLIGMVVISERPLRDSLNAPLWQLKGGFEVRRRLRIENKQRDSWPRCFAQFHSAFGNRGVLDQRRFE